MSGEDAVYELSVNLPTLPKGAPVQIVGLGTFENGSTHTVSKDEADRYRTYHRKLKDVKDSDGNVVGAKADQGPTLLQAADNMYGVEVKTVNNDKPQPRPAAPQEKAPAKDEEGGAK